MLDETFKKEEVKKDVSETLPGTKEEEEVAVNENVEPVITSQEQTPLNTNPVPTMEEVEEGNSQEETDEPILPQEQEPNLQQEQTSSEEIPGVSEEKIFTQSQVDNLIGKTRVDTREKTFRYIYERYGVENEEQLDDLIGTAQKYGVLEDEFNGAKSSWKAEEKARNDELADVKERLALMESGIDNSRYDDAKLIIKGKGLDFTLENILKEVETHPEWKKKEPVSENLSAKTDGVVEGKLEKNDDLPSEPISTIKEPTSPEVLGNENVFKKPSETDEDKAMKLFRV